MTFKVQRKLCATCIYRPENPLDLERLEAQVADGYGGFKSYRQCHHTDDSNSACCAGFWAAHKDKFQLGQLAQRLDMVEFVEIDNMEQTNGE